MLTGENEVKMCQGDYGSPLFFLDPYDYYRATLVGINVSPYLHYDCKEHNFSFFTYIPRRIEWIKKVLGEDSKFCLKPKQCSCADVTTDDDPGKITF